ncbi:ABC transporter substrate-binding protein [Acrocarpospora macrocephala]|uniref:ABC transporter substrate-binding protein n=1 Tax=Acrocarpospora macrocephala TaxID=150177 RepID=A0A5M3WJU6_9ACTN|nr:ABC transporter substrate-binding protein [Acrocarpospora macrocephala]GES09485.1 ABC transporter substrate-binding protein [Acrocarpospora macrocephala]
MTTKFISATTGAESLLSANPSRRGFLAFAGGAASLLLVGCGADGNPAVSAKSGGAPVKGGTLKFAWLGAPESIDPQINSSFAGANFSNNIVDRLLFQDRDTGEFSPWLATKWEYNDDITEYTFTLREDVTFSDGTKFNATSVKNNLDQFFNGDEALGILPNGKSYLGPYQETQVVSDYVVKVRFSAPNASFLQLSAHSGTGNISFLADKTLKSSAEDRLKPENVISTGPFIVTEYVPKVRTVITRRNDYTWAPAALGHEGPAYLDKIEFITIPEASVRVGALQSGDVPAAFDILPTDEQVLTAQGFELTARINPGFTLGWQFNLSLAPTNDINVRRAIVAATDRPGFKKTLLSNSEGEAHSVLTDGVPGFADYSQGALKYDLDLAKKLLDDAGWQPGADGIRAKDGVKLQLKGTGNILVPDARVTYEATQAALKSIGVEVEIVFDPRNIPAEQLTAEYHLANINRGRNDVAVLNTQLNPDRGNGAVIPADFPDRARIVKTFDALDTATGAAQAPLAKAVQDLIHEELVLVDPQFQTSQVAAAKGVQNIYLDGADRLLFLTTWVGGK